MARIVVTTHGTLGNTLPLIALAERLQRRGHELVLALNARMHDQALRCGLACVDNRRDALGAEEARRHAADWNHLDGGFKRSAAQIRSTIDRLFDQALPALLAACRGADLLVATPQQQFLATVVAEALAIELLPVAVTPSLYGIDLSAVSGVQDEMGSDTDPYIQERWERFRQELGRPPMQEAALHEERPPRLLLGSSPLFSQPLCLDAEIKQTGFWFHEDPLFAAWQPDPDLRAFMEQDPAPLLLSFSSQPLEDAREIVAVHVRAAARLGRPILIQQGWADFRPEHLPSDCDPVNIHFEGFLPQDWLFRHAAALIHHGGIGTTARALRNDCPMLVEPFGNDQFFNAKQIVSLGVGAAMHPQRLQPEAVAEVLQRRVLSQDTRQRVDDLGARIRAENGLEDATDFIETQFFSGR